MPASDRLILAGLATAILFLVPLCVVAAVNLLTRESVVVAW